MNQCFLYPYLRTVFIVFLLGQAPLSGQVQIYNIAPKVTDSRIDSALNDHYAFVNRGVTARNRLVVFFPGTGAEPRSYRAFPTVAANLGFHAVGLMYVNGEQVNSRCGTPSIDLDCYGAVRGEVFDGVDRTIKIAVTRANSIENRLVKLLQYLQRQYPQDNWAQYVERTSNGDTVPRWGNIIVAGHSQGGGFAGYIAVTKQVARSIMFCAIDYNPLARKLANWITGAKVTPQGEFFAMGHLRDELVPYSILSEQAWLAYGLPAAGAIVNADSLRFPIPQTRSFVTNMVSSAIGSLLTGSPFHNTPVVDVNAPTQSGRYVFQPVWEYMLTAPAITTSIQENDIAKDKITVSPNPSSQLVFVNGLTGFSQLTLRNVLGQIIRTQNTLESSAIVDVSSLPAGLYLLTVQNSGSISTMKISVQ